MAPPAPSRPATVLVPVPIEDDPELAAVIETPHWVHLVVRVENDWDTARDAASAEVEAKTEAATRYARSAAFRTRFGGRIGVVRVQSPRPAPSIVGALLTEKGIELE